MLAMELKAFFLKLSADEREAFAVKVASSVGHIQNVMYGFRPCAPDLAVRIELKSKREVTRQELRPNDWADFWPELAKRKPKARTTVEG